MGSVPNVPLVTSCLQRDPALLRLWGNAYKSVCCDAFLDLPKFSLTIFPWLQTVLILVTIVRHREEVKRGGRVKGASGDLSEAARVLLMHHCPACPALAVLLCVSVEIFFF